MERPIAEADALANARKVMKERDDKGFAQIARALGIELTLATYYPYVAKHARSPWADLTDACGEGGLRLLFTALTSEHGHAMAVVYGQTILVARTASGDRVVFAMQDGAESKPFKPWGWKITPRWYKDPARNRPTIENWLADPARATDALTIPITRAFAASPPDDRGAALRAAVCADPEDVAARLVYADWLVEQGDVRGELVRVQCDLASATGERKQALAARADELLRAYTTTIVEPIKRFVDGAKIHRGLIEEIEVFGDQLLKHGGKLVAEHPITRLHALVKDADQFAKLATMPWIGKIADVVYEGRSEKRVINSGAKLEPSSAVGTAMFARTRRLGFPDVTDSAKQWAKLYAGISAPMLERLDTDGLGEAAVVALARSAGLPRLSHLTLSALDASARHPELLAELAARKLRTVTVHYVGMDRIGACLTALLAPSVRALHLDDVSGAGIATALADGGRHLEELTLRQVTIDLDELADLIAEGTLAKLQRLVVTGVPGDGDAREAFTRAVCAASKRLSTVSWGPDGRGEGSRPTGEQAARIRASGRIL